MTGESDLSDIHWRIVLGWAMLTAGVIIWLGSLPVVANGNFWIGANMSFVAAVMVFLGILEVIVQNIIRGDPNAR